MVILVLYIIVRVWLLIYYKGIDDIYYNRCILENIIYKNVVELFGMRWNGV